MLLLHRGKSPKIDPSACVAPTAVISGDVTIGSESCIGVKVAKTGPIANEFRRRR